MLTGLVRIYMAKHLWVFRIIHPKTVRVWLIMLCPDKASLLDSFTTHRTYSDYAHRSIKPSNWTSVY